MCTKKGAGGISHCGYFQTCLSVEVIAKWIANNHHTIQLMQMYDKTAKELLHRINLNGIPLDRVTEFKYILITGELSWTTHMNMICTKPRRLTGMLYRQFKLGVMYIIIHGLADFSNVPISARDNPFDLQSLNPCTLSGFTAKTNSLKDSFFFLRIIIYHQILMWL